MQKRQKWKQLKFTLQEVVRTNYFYGCQQLNNFNHSKSFTVN